eukprot:94231-Chlamydomonas_euryale.AAC.1
MWCAPAWRTGVARETRSCTRCCARAGRRGRRRGWLGAATTPYRWCMLRTLRRMLHACRRLQPAVRPYRRRTASWRTPQRRRRPTWCVLRARRSARGRSQEARSAARPAAMSAARARCAQTGG